MSNTLEQLKRERELERKAEQDKVAERRREADQPLAKRTGKWIVAHPKHAAGIFAGVVLALVLLRVALAGLDYLEAQSHLSSYYELSEQGNYEQAQAELALYLQSKPEDWGHQIEYGVLLVRLGRVEEASRVLTAVSGSSAEGRSADVQYYYALSQIKYDSKLISGMDAVLAGLSNYLPALLGRGAAQYRLDPSEGLDHYEQAVARVEELDQGSDIYMRSQAQANDFLTLACRQNPQIFAYKVEDPAIRPQDDPDEQLLFDFSFAGLGPQQQYIFGIDNSLYLDFCGLTVARSARPGQQADLRALVYMLHAFAQAKAGNYEAAAASISESMQTSVLPEAIYLDGTIAALSGAYEEAVAKLQEGLGSNDPFMMVSASHALIHKAAEDWPEAKELLTRAVGAGNEASAVAFNNRGVLHLTDALPGQARNDFDKAAELVADYPHATYNIGISHMLDGNYADALGLFNKLLSSRNVFPGLHYYTALCYQRLGKGYQAQADLRYAIHDRYFSGHAYTLLGDIYSEQEIFAQKATDSYQKAYDLLPEDYAIGFKLAQSLSRNGQPVAASSVIDRIVEASGPKHGKDSNYRLLLDATRGEVYFALNDPQALRFLENSYSAAEDPVLKTQLAVTYANLLIKSGRPDEAAEITRDILSVSANNVAILIVRARALLAQQNISQASNTIRGALEKAPENYTVQMVAGEIFAAADSIDQALAAYNAAHNLEPANVFPLEKQLELLRETAPEDLRIARLQEEIDNAELLAASTAQEERVGKSQAVLPGAIIQDPAAIAAANEQIGKLAVDLEEGNIDDFTGYQNMAGLKIQVGDFTGALEDMQRAASIDPDEVGPWRNIGRLNVFLGRFDAASEAYLKAVAIDPSDPSLYTSLGTVRQRFPDKEPAIGDFTKVLEFEPSNIRALLARGDLYAAVERYDESIADFTRAIRLDERNLCAYEYRRSIYVLLGEREKAESDAEIINVLREEGQGCS